jgi:hypothetical protein
MLANTEYENCQIPIGHRTEGAVEGDAACALSQDATAINAVAGASDHQDDPATAKNAVAGNTAGVPSQDAAAAAKNAVAGAGDAQALPAVITQEVTAPRPVKLAFLPPGWAQLTPTAVKLWMTLLFLGPRGKATQKELAAIAGMSERAVLSAFQVLGLHGLLNYKGAPGKGTAWQLTGVPHALPVAAKELYAARLEQQEQHLGRRKAELEQDRQALEDAASGVEQERFRALKESIFSQADT